MLLKTLQLHNFQPAFLVLQKLISSTDGIKTEQKSDLNFVMLLADGIISPGSLHALRN
jgi:hypothetical protein